MTITQGQDVVLKVSGTGLSFTGEACTDSGDHLTYQITDTDKQVWDATATITPKIDGVAATAGTYTIDRLFGMITFDSSQNGHTITVDGTYLPMTELGLATSAKTSLKSNNGDQSTLNGSGYVERGQLLKDVLGEVVRFELADAFFGTLLQAGTVIVVETSMGGTVDSRAWALIDNDDDDGSADSFVAETFAWSGAADADGRSVSFGP